MVVKNTVKRLLRQPEGSFFLFGPRGTGKSTWLRATFRDAHYVDLLDERRYRGYLGNAGLFTDEMRALVPGSTVVVDEIQRIPALLNEVHRGIEELELRFVLSGSSARKLKQAGTNLLAGRAVRRFLHPFVPEELCAAFDLEVALRQGTLPIIWGAADPADALRAYADMYLKEEIQAEALVRNLPGFARFLPIAALFHGQTINVSSLARDAGVARTTVEGYLGVIEDTLLAFRLPAYTPKLRVRERAHPKLYFTDAGVARALRGRTGALSDDERGPLLEGLVASVLRAYRDYRGLFDEWFYWAPTESARTEVDFLLRRGDALVAIEVKATTAWSDRLLRGLRAAAEMPGLARRVLVHLGTERYRSEDGIDALPIDELFREIETGELWPK
jgi:predicted AAA+ superfamily ATPase